MVDDLWSGVEHPAPPPAGYGGRRSGAGRPVGPGGRRVRLGTITLPPVTLAKLRALAREEGVAITTVLERLIDQA